MIKFFVAFTNKEREEITIARFNARFKCMNSGQTAKRKDKF